MTTETASRIDISRALGIGGWMSESELMWLASLASNSKRIVEFGSHHGRSTRALADNSPDDAKVWAVDPWGGSYKTDDDKIVADLNTYVMPYFKDNLKDHIENGKVIPVRQFSYNFNLDEKVDVVFIDGDHRYETVIKDIHKALGLLKFKGIICGHDYGHPLWPGVKQAADEIFGRVGVEETIWWSRKY